MRAARAQVALAPTGCFKRRKCVRWELVFTGRCCVTVGFSLKR
jgi:hypothetical protein